MEEIMNSLKSGLFFLITFLIHFSLYFTFNRLIGGDADILNMAIFSSLFSFIFIYFMRDSLPTWRFK